MTTFRIRLVEETIKEGACDFAVAALSAEAAAAIVDAAYQKAAAEGTNLITLPEGQQQVLEAERFIRRSVVFLLLDADGLEVGEIHALSGRTHGH